MAVTLTDQVTYANGVSLAGVAYPYGALLPAPAGPADVAVRAAMRASGMLRPVVDTDTATEFNAQVKAAVQTDPAGYVQTVDSTGVTVIAGPGT